MLNKKALEALRMEMGFKQIKTENPQLLKILHRLKMAALQEVNILLQGETGTGKELCAEAIHYISDRKDKPFIIFNCGIGPADLFESTVFGHARGAFTGAIADHVGLVEEAEKGILFLDEINSLSLSAQVKLNRFLVTGEFRRVGDNKLRRVDTRIIVASNCPLENEVKQGRFREDLYYRISEYMIELPPLRERGDDIPFLMDHFLTEYARSFGKPELKFTKEVYRIAQQYHWPGNIRELQNVIKQSIIDTSSNYITMEEFSIQPVPQITSLNSEYFSLPLNEAKSKVVNDFEIHYLQHHLQRYNGNVEQCARSCKKHRSALWALIKKHNIDPQMYRR